MAKSFDFDKGVAAIYASDEFATISKGLESSIKSLRFSDVRFDVFIQENKSKLKINVIFLIHAGECSVIAHRNFKIRCRQIIGPLNLLLQFGQILEPYCQNIQIDIVNQFLDTMDIRFESIIEEASIRLRNQFCEYLEKPYFKQKRTEAVVSYAKQEMDKLLSIFSNLDFETLQSIFNESMVRNIMEQ
jgi:hypothetical protein